MQAPFADPLSGLELLTNTLPLVGRDTEMQLICALLDTVSLNRPVGARALMISGDMGVGKTRLLAEMCIEARARGFRLLEGRTYASGASFPYLPFIEALRPVLRSSSIEQLRRFVGLDELRSYPGDPISLTGTPLVASLARLFPELPRMVSVTIAPEILSPDQEKFRLFDAVATLLERMAMDCPVLLSIDNLQWADSASLELTMYLTVRLHNSPVALAGVTRPPGTFNEHTESGDSVVSTTASLAAARALGELMRQGLLLFLPLGPLSTDAAEQHLHALLPGPFSRTVAQPLLSRSEGNPFFLEELVRMLTLNGQLILHDGVWRTIQGFGPELPESLILAVGQRLQGLSPLCRELLRVASLFGRTFPLPALVMVMEAPEDTVQSLLDEAMQAAVIARLPMVTTLWDKYVDELTGEDILKRIPPSQVASPAGYMFCQGIVQEVLSNEVPTYRVSALHGAIGSALEANYGDAALAYAAELARHYVLSGKKESALRWSLLAGEDAARQQAYREAIGHFRTVLKLMEAQVSASHEKPLPSPAQLHISIGESWFKLGELEQASVYFQQALEQLQREKNTMEEQSRESSLLSAKVNRLIADVYRMQGKYELALAHLQAARNALNASMDDQQKTNVNLDQKTYPSWMSQRRFSAGTGLLPGLKQVDTTENILLLQAQATLDLLLNRSQEAEMALWKSHQLATEIGDRSSQAFALHMVGWIRGWGEHINEAIRLQEQAHELYVAVGDPFRAALGDQGLGIIYQALGEMEKARLHNLRGFEQARRYGVRHVLGWLHWNQGLMALAQGNWAASESQLNQSMLEAEATNNARLKPVVLQAQAELYFRQGNWHEAEQRLQAAIQASVNTEWYPCTIALYGHFLAVIGHRTAAQVQLERAVALPEPAGYSGQFYIPFLAEAFLHLGANERAATYIQRIQSLHGFMYYGVSVDRILGEVATLEGDWNRAEQAFEDGLKLCRRVNNQPEEAMILYEQARAALMRSSVEPSKRRHSLLEDVHRLCDRAQELFLQYNMQRAADLVDTLREGASQLALREDEKPSGLVVQEHISHPDYHLDLHLTRRELEVLRLVAEGHTDREVAEALIISPRTVNRHLGNIFVKLDVPGRAAAVAYAIRQGLVG